MKRAIKSSFGLNDNSWLEPDPDYWDMESDYVECEFNGEVVHTDSTSYITDLEDAVEKSLPLGDVYTEDFEINVSNKEDMVNKISEYVDDDLQGTLNPNSSYKLTGTVTVYYKFAKYNGPDYVDDPVDFDTIREDGVDVNIEAVKVS